MGLVFGFCLDFLRALGVQTPTIVRFSTVIHERGSPETIRDPRGFATKFTLERVTLILWETISRCSLLVIACRSLLYGRKGVQGAQPGPVLSWTQRVKIAYGAARGLEYLHEKVQPSIVHHDVRSSNVLLFDDFQTKIADFNFILYYSLIAGHNGTYSQLDGSGLMNSSGGTYPDASLLYYMPGYNPYATGTYMGVDRQQPYYSSSEAMPCYGWSSTSSLSAKSAAGTTGMKSTDFSSKRALNSYTSKSSTYPLDMKSRQQSTSSVSKQVHIIRVNFCDGLLYLNNSCVELAIYINICFVL